MNINGNHQAVKAVRNVRRGGEALAKWIRGASDDDCIAVATFLLSDGLDVFPTGQDGTKTKQYKEFNVFRQSYRREREGLTLSVDSKAQRITIKEKVGRNSSDNAHAKAAERKLSKAEDTVVELTQNREADDQAMVIARQARRLGLTLDQLAEAFAKLEEQEAEREADKAAKAEAA